MNVVLCVLRHFSTAMFQELGGLIELLWKAGQRKKAQALLAWTLNYYPQHALPIALLEARLHREDGNIPSEAACLERARFVSPNTSAGKAGEIWASYAAFQMRNGDLEAARNSCVNLLALMPDPKRRVVILDRLACVPLLYGGTRNLLPDAENWCREGLILEPENVELQGTWGALLVEQHRPGEGMAILQVVFTRMDADYGRGITAFYLALAAHQLGLREEMANYRQMAKRLCAVPALQKRLLRELSAA